MELTPDMAIPIMIGVLVLLLILQILMFVFLFRKLTKAWSGGWQRIAELYPAPALLIGQKISNQTLQVGIMRYKRMVKVVIGEKGLGLARNRFVPWGQKPGEVFIPWNDITGCFEPKNILDWGYALTLAKDIPLKVSKKSFLAMRQYIPHSPRPAHENLSTKPRR